MIYVTCKGCQVIGKIPAKRYLELKKGKDYYCLGCSKKFQRYFKDFDKENSNGQS